MGYLANFMVYTLAMIGVIAIALIVFKNANSFGGAGKSKHLKVIDTLSIAPRKTLYVVSTGREKFLIAGDVGNTTLNLLFVKQMISKKLWRVCPKQSQAIWINQILE